MADRCAGRTVFRRRGGPAISRQLFRARCRAARRTCLLCSPVRLAHKVLVRLGITAGSSNRRRALPFSAIAGVRSLPVVHSVATRASSGVSAVLHSTGTVGYREQVEGDMLHVLGHKWPIGLGFLHPSARYVAGMPVGVASAIRHGRVQCPDDDGHRWRDSALRASSRTGCASWCARAEGCGNRLRRFSALDPLRWRRLDRLGNCWVAIANRVVQRPNARNDRVRAGWARTRHNRAEASDRCRGEQQICTTPRRRCPPSATPLERRPAPIPSGRELNRIRVLIPTSRHIYRTVSYGMVVDFEDAVARASDVDVVPVPLRSRRAQAKALLRGRPRSSALEGRRREWDPTTTGQAPPLVIRHMPIGSDGSRLVTGPALPPGSQAFVCARRRVPVRLVAERSAADHQAAPRLAVGRRFVRLIPPHARALRRATAMPRALPATGDRSPLVSSSPRRAPHRRPVDRAAPPRGPPSTDGTLPARDLFYYYQTHIAPGVGNPADYRPTRKPRAVGQLCRSARVHVGWSVDSTNPARAGEGAAITARWFESAASGAAVIGSAPRTEEFGGLFPVLGFCARARPDCASRD